MKLREARLRYDFDEWQLARVLEVHVSHVRGLENGTQLPSRLLLKRIRAVLPGVEMDVRVPKREAPDPRVKGGRRRAIQ